MNKVVLLRRNKHLRLISLNGITQSTQETHLAKLTMQHSDKHIVYTYSIYNYIILFKSSFLYKTECSALWDCILHIE